MEAFYGTIQDDFKPNIFEKKRYGFPCLFLTNEESLAITYACYQQNEKSTVKTAYVYKIEINTPNIEIDFEWNSSYNFRFRNLIFDLKKQFIPTALIKNVRDSPNIKKYAEMYNDIIVVLDFSEIVSIKKYKKIQFNN